MTPGVRGSRGWPRRGWWRRNRVGLIVLAVLVPGSVAAVGGLSWWDDFSSRANVPVTARGADPVSLGGSDFGPAQATVVTDTTGLKGIPPTAKVVAVNVPVHPNGKTKPTCSSPVLVEQSTGRRWAEMGHTLGVAFDPDHTTSCATASDHTGPLEMITFYLVPQDAAGPFWVDVDVIDARPEFARFSVSP